jgi:asparagine synthase (glutamine-hydrolysing)
LIRCNGFCLSVDAKHARIASKEASRIDRVTKGGIRRFNVDLGEVQAFSVEGGDGLPIVHGFFSDQECDDEGEFSALEPSGNSIVCRRDLAGTRPLYIAKSGEWVASDHRFFPDEESVILPPGSTYDVKGKVTTGARRREQGEFDGTFAEAGSALAEAVQSAVRARVAGHGVVAVAFSGGLDSSILAHCAKQYSRVVAISVGVEGSRDSLNASRSAEELGVEFRQARIDANDLQSELSRIDLPFAPTSMDKSLWCIYSIASRVATANGAELILLGQLADELFGGYLKYQRALVDRGEREAARMMEDDVAECGRRGFIRDEAACARWNEPRFPFADRRILELGLGLPASFKIRGGVRKAVLRAAAMDLGVPEGICSAPKKAAQYSTGVMKLMGQFI